MSTFDFKDLQPDTPNIKQETVTRALKIVQKFPGAKIGGSFLVLGDQAKDLDLFMDKETWYDVREWLVDQGLTYQYKSERLNDYYHDAGSALYAVVDCGQLQFIVVLDEFIRAYELSAEIMQKNEHLFRNKDNRVALHRILRHLCDTGEIKPKE